MTQSEDKGKKILFRFDSEILEQEIVETIWADIVDLSKGHFKLDSIPFFVPRVATDDIVQAEYDDAEEMLTYRETILASGNSTVWVIIMDDTNIDEVRKIFNELDCISEALSDRYFAMEVKASTNYLQVRDRLNELKTEGIIDFAEPCLSVIHQY